MQDSLAVQKYQEKSVPSYIMNGAASIYDILNKVNFLVSNNEVILQYTNNGNIVTLGRCSYFMHGSTLTLSGFYTANLHGIDEDFKTRTQASNDVHVLQSPIKYIGKEMFRKFLDMCREHHLTSISLVPLAKTDSIVFYKKMATYFPDRINEIISEPDGKLVYLLN